MTCRMPPFKSIEAFVVAARALSFTEAASLLHITVPAVSRRIQALETELGVPLFSRAHRTLELTRAGESYLSDLGPAIETIRDASARIRGASRRQCVRVSLPVSFAASWLVPRLPHFHARYGGVQVELESSNGEFVDLDQSEADLAVRLGTGHWPHLWSERLLDVEAYPVCSADFLARNPLRSIGDLIGLPLLGITSQPELWSEWLRHADAAADAPVRQAFDNFHLLYRAAASGLGIALGIEVLVKPYLEEARLVRPLNAHFKLAKGYYILCRAVDRERRPLSTFRNWLIAEASSAAAGASWQ